VSLDNLFITGIAGTLGSSLAEIFLKRGVNVRGNDIVRVDEAWRLSGIKDDVEYLWKSSFDLQSSDLEGCNAVVDCGVGYPDRPFGANSPRETCLGNINPALGLLETVKAMRKKPVVVYPSSFNVFYGNIGGEITEKTKLSPASLYGWSKAAAELLYFTYYKAYGVPVIVTRVGSAFGAKGRSDELPHKLILYSLKNKTFHLKSPKAKRLWTYSEDVLNFYGKLFEALDGFVGETLHCAGNLGDKIVTNTQLAEKILKVTDSSMKIMEAPYEPGEIINGKPVDFSIDSAYTREALNWQPKYTLEQGLRETVRWFKENLGKFL